MNTPPFDGNASAGDLADIFDFDVTTAVTTCATCHHTHPVATLGAYPWAPGLVLRCASCEAVQLRLVRSPRADLARPPRRRAARDPDTAVTGLTLPAFAAAAGCVGHNRAFSTRRRTDVTARPRRLSRAHSCHGVTPARCAHGPPARHFGRRRTSPSRQGGGNDMNTSTKVRVAIISLLGGSALLLGPVAAVAQAATGGEQPGSETTDADAADKLPMLYDNAGVVDGVRIGDRWTRQPDSATLRCWDSAARSGCPRRRRRAERRPARSGWCSAVESIDQGRAEATAADVAEVASTASRTTGAGTSVPSSCTSGSR